MNFLVIIESAELRRQELLAEAAQARLAAEARTPRRSRVGRLDRIVSFLRRSLPATVGAVPGRGPMPCVRSTARCPVASTKVVCDRPGIGRSHV
jgi:hypothetical protein